MTATKITILDDPRFFKLADRYLPLLTEDGSLQDYESFLTHKLTNLEKNEFLIPVLGVQGAGKSSLLNALLMDDLILPVDADETTCIPVEIRFSEVRNGEIEVYFADKASPTTLQEPTELEQYVHNAYNYGNEKNVSHIVVYKNSDILKNGVVFVDLPGVKSLTQQNMQTTMNYIEKLSAAIFLLRTVPPITRSERMFLSTVWPKLTKAWFIQNQWNDESNNEVKDGLEHNKNVLSEIAAYHGTNEELDIRIVNVYKALNGRLQEDEAALSESGLTKLTDYISDITNTWRVTLSEKFVQDVQVLVTRLKMKLEERLEDSKLDRKALRKKYREQERKYEDIIRGNQCRISKIKQDIERYEMEMKNYAQSQGKLQSENLRNEMRRITGSKVVDGDLLTISFNENQQLLALDAIEGLNDKLFEIKKQLEVDLGHLEVKNMNNEFENVNEFYKESSLKFEKVLAPAIGIGGSIGGMYTGMAVGTALGGPIGTVVGGIVGATVTLGIGLFSSFIGKKSKEYIEDYRQKVTMSDLEDPILAFKENLVKTFTKHINAYFTTIHQTLDQFVDIQERQLEAEKEEHTHNMKLSEEDIADRRTEIENDLDYLAKMEVSI
jgi:hypothetical protein